MSIGCQGHQGCAYPKSHKVSEGFCFIKLCVQFHHYNVKVGRCAQGKQWCWTQGQWPKKECWILLHVLKNAEGNAELKGIDVNCLVVEYIQVKRAPKMLCRTYRVQDCLIWTWAPPATLRWSRLKEQTVPKLVEEVAQKKKISQKKLKQNKT